QLVVSPLNATQGSGVRLTAFSVPDRPASDRWPATVLDDSLNRMHNRWHLDLNDDGTSETLTASQEGIHLIARREDEFRRRQLARAMPGDEPAQQGAGEIKVGQLDTQTPFIATIEPMHGTSVVIYTRPEGGLRDSQMLERLV